MPKRMLGTRLATIALLLCVLAGCTPGPAAPPAAGKPAAQPTAAGAPAPQPTAAGPGADSRAVADFYRGKTVRIVVGFAAGGGFDLYSRLIAKHMRKYVPGNPNVIVENMPGASSLLALNYVANSGPKDGTVIGNVIGSLVLQQLFGAPGVEFDMTRLHYLGMPVGATLVMTVARRAGISSVDDVLGPNARPVVIGTTAPGAGNHDAPTLMRDVLGANIRVVSGYAGTSNVRLAMETGEVDGIFNPWESTKITSRELVDSGEWLLLTQFLNRPSPELPNVPLVFNYARTDEQRQLLDYGAVIPNQFEKVYVLAGEVPDSRVAALRDAFASALRDPELLSEAEKAKQDIVLIPGDEVRARIVEFMNMPVDVKQKLQPLMSP